MKTPKKGEYKIKTNSLHAQRETVHINRPEKKGQKSTHKLKSTEEGACEDKEKGKEFRSGTHLLETAEGGTCQDTVRMRLSVGH